MALVPGIGSFVNWIIWDTVITAAGSNTASEIQFFVVPEGSGGKTKNDTNMQIVKSLVSPEYFNCTHLGIEFAPQTIEQDYQSLLQNYWLEFWVYDRIQVEGPIGCFPGGTMVYHDSTRTNVGSVANGFGTGVGVMFDLRVPAGMVQLANGQLNDGLQGIPIGQNQQFYLSLKGTPFTVNANGPGLRLRAYLHGQKARAISG